MKHKLSSLLLIACFVCIMYAIFCAEPMANHSNKLSKKDSIEKLNVVVDSLNDVIFNLETQNGRYEITLELLKEKDSIAAEKFENILTTQTE